MVRIRFQTTILALALGTALAGCDRPEVPSAQPAPAAAPSQDAATAGPPAVAAGAAELLAVDTSAPLVPMDSCNFEALDGQAFADAAVSVPAGADFLVSGFAYDKARQLVPAKLRLRVIAADGSAWEAPISGRLDRPDVVTYFKLGDWARGSGFEQLVSSKSLAAGEYRLVLVFDGADQVHACDNGRRMVLSS